ncbi:hypothetical protein IL54_1115 [Sphingobium sp. ba1]|nr:hypothetical protein IL54_1115 [Sphingobium sp. ba1]
MRSSGIDMNNYRIAIKMATSTGT